MRYLHAFFLNDVKTHKFFVWFMFVAGQLLVRDNVGCRLHERKRCVSWFDTQVQQNFPTTYGRSTSSSGLVYNRIISQFFFCDSTGKENWQFTGNVYLLMQPISQCFNWRSINPMSFSSSMVLFRTGPLKVREFIDAAFPQPIDWTGRSHFVASAFTRHNILRLLSVGVTWRIVCTVHQL